MVCNHAIRAISYDGILFSLLYVCFIESTCRCSRVRGGGESTPEDGSFAGISGSTSMELSSVLFTLLLFFCNIFIRV